MIHIALLLLLSAFANTPTHASDIEDNTSFYSELYLTDSYWHAKEDRARQYKEKHSYKKDAHKKDAQPKRRRQRTTRNTMNDDALKAEKLKMLDYYSYGDTTDTQISEDEDDTTAETDSQISEYESDSTSLNDDTTAERCAREYSEFMESRAPKFISKLHAIIEKTAATIALAPVPEGTSLEDRYRHAKEDRARQYKEKHSYKKDAHKKDAQPKRRRQRTTRNTMNDDALKAEKLKMLGYYSYDDTTDTQISEDEDDTTDSQISEDEDDTTAERHAREYSEFMKSRDPNFISKMHAIIAKKAAAIALAPNRIFSEDSYSDAKEGRAWQSNKKHFYKKNEQSNGRRQKGTTTTRNTMNSKNSYACLAQLTDTWQDKEEPIEDKKPMEDKNITAAEAKDQLLARAVILIARLEGCTPVALEINGIPTEFK